MFDIRTVLCPIDFSPGSDRAMAHAMALASKYGAEVHLVHVCPLDIFAGPDGGLLTPEVVSRISRDSQAALEKIAEAHRAPERAVHVHVTAGFAADEITRLASKVGADLIVVGTHGRRGLKLLLLGSVTEQIVRTSTVPVLTVRMPEA
jgi:nucleotide-binding universal stress UspA family protein